MESGLDRKLTEIRRKKDGRKIKEMKINVKNC